MLQKKPVRAHILVHMFICIYVCGQHMHSERLKVIWHALSNADTQ